MAFTAGARVGAYEITALIGAGGMGEVYRARDTRLKRDVAIKVLPDAFANDPERLARFQREAELLATLNHPYIAQIYGLEDGALVLELVEGPTLADRIAQGPIPLDEALPIAKQIAEALEAAHERGIIHRDLKPANIKLTPDGTVKVLDFGLAKALEPASAVRADLSNSPTITSPAMTMGGAILGTASYMSPEQAKGRPADKRGDIWAFGCVLFEMLSQVRPFSGEDLADVLAEIMKAEPNWTRLPANTPSSVIRLLKRCLRKQQRDRLDSATAVRLELTDVEESKESPASGQRNSRRAWLPVALSSLILIVALGAVLRPRQPVPSPFMRLEIGTPESARPDQFAISPNGRWLAFIANADGVASLWVRPVDSPAARSLPGTNDAAQPFWSPDGRSIAFVSGSALKRINVDGTGLQTLAPAANSRAGDWNADGLIVFGLQANGGLGVVPASGGTIRQVTDAKQAGHAGLGHRLPRFLPDGNSFLYLSEDESDHRSIRVGSLNGSVDTHLIDVSVTTAAEYHPAGFIMFVDAGHLYAERFDLRSMKVIGEKFLALGADADPILPAVSIADNGTFLYRHGVGAGAADRLVWRDRAGKLLAPTFAVNGLEPDISPDGRRAVVVRNSSGNNDVWLVDLARAVPSRLTIDPGTELWPVWSPSGNEIAFGRESKIFAQVLGGDRRVLLDNDQANTYPAAWSPDGRFVLYRATGADTSGDVWALPVTSAEKPFPVVTSRFDETRPQFSPDGRWVSYESNESGQFEIYVRPFNRAGLPVQVSVNGGSEARWNPTGNEIFYVAPGSHMMSAKLRMTADAIDVEPPVELFATQIFRRGMQTTNYKFQYAVATDGKRFLINETVDPGPARPLIITLNWLPERQNTD